jgi:hypothetical protein
LCTQSFAFPLESPWNRNFDFQTWYESHSMVTSHHSGNRSWYTEPTKYRLCEIYCCHDNYSNLQKESYLKTFWGTLFQCDCHPHSNTCRLAQNQSNIVEMGLWIRLKCCLVLCRYGHTLDRALTLFFQSKQTIKMWEVNLLVELWFCR